MIKKLLKTVIVSMFFVCGISLYAAPEPIAFWDKDFSVPELSRFTNNE